MCTVSWSFNGEGYRLYFNRDEQRSRIRAERPRLIEWQGAELIAPIDPQGGGSWIALNRAGIVAFVLNNYAASTVRSNSNGYRSRGEIPLAVASKGNVSSCLQSIESFGQNCYRPFIAGVLSPNGELKLVSWDGSALKPLDLGCSFATTSSYRSRAVESYRRERYEALMVSGGGDWAWSHGLDYHQDLGHSDPAFNPLMSREDAETHCISLITATSEQTRFEYLERIANTNGFSRAGECSFGE